ncbi:MAG: LON peptidase substrate-binding domain-containing protein [Opitutaceae bacterium]
MQDLEIPSEVPVMTLGNTTLFPQAIMPLHIFEPRYREMLDYVLENDRIFAVAGLNEAATDAEVFETPHRIASVGLVRACHQNPDGTSNLILQGLARIEMESIVSEEPYRTAKIKQIMSETGGSSEDLHSIPSRIVALLKTQRRLGAKIPPEVITFLDKMKDPENVLDIAIYTLCPPGPLKQDLLETRGVVPRFSKFSRYLVEEVERLKLDSNLKGGLDEGDVGMN